MSEVAKLVIYNLRKMDKGIALRKRMTT